MIMFHTGLNIDVTILFGFVLNQFGKAIQQNVQLSVWVLGPSSLPATFVWFREVGFLLEASSHLLL